MRALNRALRARIIAPQTENKLSTLAADTGMLKYLRANFAKTG